MASRPIKGTLQLIRSKTRIVGNIVGISPGYESIEMQMPSAAAPLFANSRRADLEFSADNSPFHAEVEIEMTTEKTVLLRLLMPPKRIIISRQTRTEMQMKMMYRPIRGVLEAWHRAETIDVSQNGMCIETPKVIYPGESLEIRVPIKSPSEVQVNYQTHDQMHDQMQADLQLLSKVLYCKTSRQGHYRIGLSHSDITSSDEQKIRILLGLAA